MELKMELKNYTPHKINIMDEKNEVILTINPEKTKIRVKELIEECTPLSFKGCNIKVVGKKYESIEGLPMYDPNIRLIVSNLVLQASGRADLISPDTGPESAVRDEKNQIIGVKRFQKRLGE